MRIAQTQQLTRAVPAVLWIYASVRAGKTDGLSCLEVAENKRQL